MSTVDRGGAARYSRSLEKRRVPRRAAAGRVEKARTSGVRAGGGATAPTRCEGPLLVAVGILVIALFVVAMSGRNCHFNIHR
jgi:hypothetical protein